MPSSSTSTDFYAGVNQPATPPAAYLWTPLIILAAGILALALGLAYLSRSDRRTADLPDSFFDQ